MLFATNFQLKTIIVAKKQTSKNEVLKQINYK